jgi:enamine deaminase RidA (YjgF/YER057c/UK114 family)
MEQRRHNPWTWQNQFGFSHGIEVSGASRILYCAGQISTDAEGKPLHVGDMRGQVEQAMQNLATVLKTAGYTLGDVVRLNFYTTDMEQFHAANDIIVSHLAKVGNQPSSTLLGVAKLAFPEALVEIEATAMK